MLTLPDAFGADDSDQWLKMAEANNVLMYPDPADLRNAVARHLARAYFAAVALRERADRMQRRDYDVQGETSEEWDRWIHHATALELAAERLLTSLVLDWCGAPPAGQLAPGWGACVAEVDGHLFIVAPAADNDPRPRLLVSHDSRFESSQYDT